MATKIITTADSGKTIALYSSTDTIVLSANATSQTIVRLVHQNQSLDTGTRLITAGEGVSIRGWITDVPVTEIILSVDGQIVQLMFDQPNLTWYVVSKYVPAEMLSPPLM